MQFILQKKSLIFSVILFLFASFIFLFLYKEINNKRVATQQAQEKWQTENSHRENMRSLVNSIKTIESERKLLETHFVQNSDIVPFLDTIERLAREAGVKAEVVSVDVTKDIPSLIVEMKAQGNFETIYKLVVLLENSQYDLRFASVNIQNQNEQDISASKTNKAQLWTAAFRIKVLSFVNK